MINVFKAITGKGTQASIDGKSLKVVSSGYLKENNLQASITKSAQAETVVYILQEMPEFLPVVGRPFLFV